jgi:hypothetical protein
MFDLRAWLRRAPKPRKLRLKVDGEDRMVDLGEGRYKWAEVEQTVRTAGPSAVECLDKDGAILRAYKFAEDEVDAEDDEDAGRRSLDKVLGKERRELAAVLDAQGRAIERAYSAGAKAASVSQENLVNIVETLTGHLSLAITNIHTLSSAYANAVATAGAGDDGNKPDALMGLITGLLAVKNGPPVASPPAHEPPKKNGGR